MGTLHAHIVSKFLERLAEAKYIDAAMRDSLRDALLDGKKPKPDDLIKVFTKQKDGSGDHDRSCAHRGGSRYQEA